MTSVSLKNISKRFKNAESDAVSNIDLKIENKGDRTLIYKLFAGSAEYLKNSVVLKHTGQFDPMLGRVQTSYGWDREKYPDFTQAVSDFLVEVGYEEPRGLSEESDKKWFQGIFESLVSAITTNG